MTPLEKAIEGLNEEKKILTIFLTGEQIIGTGSAHSRLREIDAEIRALLSGESTPSTV